MDSDSSIRDRDRLYRLMISQLRYDGYETVATNLARNFSAYPPSSPSSRLSHLVSLGLQMEGEASKPDSVDMLPHIRGRGVMDLEYENDENILAPPAHRHDIGYVTSHKGPILCANFSHDGRLVATGSADMSIRIMDVDRMMSGKINHHDHHPVIRTITDHLDAVLCLCFHPTVSVLASGSCDNTVKFYDYSKPSVKKAYRSLMEVASVRCLTYHPCGQYMLIGTEQSTLRLYDANTFQCFVSSDSRDQHSLAINSVHYSADGKTYVTSSKDGSIKVWDGISNRCINTFNAVHSGEPVGSARFSKNGKFVLTAGMDGQAKLIELSSGNCLNTYKATKTIKPRCLPTAVFNHTEDYVLMGEEGQNMILCWDTRTTQSFRSLFTSHQGPIRSLAHSPLIPGFVTGSDDTKVRFFCFKEH